jgi:hypothetical protein
MSGEVLVEVTDEQATFATLYAAWQADGFVLSAEPDVYGEDGGQIVIEI